MTVGVPPSTVGESAKQTKAVKTNGIQPLSALAEQEKVDYIKNHVELFDLSAHYFNSTRNGKMPGVTFKMRNTGSRTLVQVEVTAYFKDSADKIIAKETYYPVLPAMYSWDNDTPLTPNYVWEMRGGSFYSASGVPSGWEGAAEAKVTDIRFEEPKTK